MTTTTCECGQPKDRRAKACRRCFLSASLSLVEKACTKCHTVLPVEDFAWRPNGRGGQKRRSQCRACEAAAARAHREQNPEKHAAAKRAWEKNNPEKLARITLRSSARRLGFDPDMIEAHNGLCDICHLPSEQRLAIDHDHATGAFRGLLCGSCNNGLGRFADDIERLRSAILYLQG